MPADHLTTVLIGTRKGLVVARRGGAGQPWVSEPIRFPLNAVYAVGIDPRPATPRLFASIYSEWSGTNLAYSDDFGTTWVEPVKPPIRFPEGADTALKRIWQVTPAPAELSGVVYAGTEPSALFRSNDGGETFELVQSLWDHPHRKEWGEGYGGQAIHSILPHPHDPQRMSVAMSTGGVYRTSDGGDSWSPTNRGIRVVFMPDEYPEFGQCVHKFARDPAVPERMYLQNHGGVYRSDDDGDSWTPIESGLPSTFGFPVVAHPRRPDTVYAFPLSDTDRMPPERACRVYRTQDAGASWQPLGNGLPQQNFYPGVMRDAMCADTATGATAGAATGLDDEPAGIYFGSRGGEVFASDDDGESWTTVTTHLPDVLSVRALTH
jgi:phage pi2 protein 07